MQHNPTSPTSTGPQSGGVNTTPVTFEGTNVNVARTDFISGNLGQVTVIPYAYGSVDYSDDFDYTFSTGAPTNTYSIPSSTGYIAGGPQNFNVEFDAVNSFNTAEVLDVGGTGLDTSTFLTFENLAATAPCTIWFPANMNMEFYLACGPSQASYGSNPVACAADLSFTPTPNPSNSNLGENKFIALPYNFNCSTIPPVRIVNQNDNSTSYVVDVADKGPDPTLSDNYWNTGNLPSGTGEGGDCSDALGAALGVSPIGCVGTNATGNLNAYWRFEN